MAYSLDDIGTVEAWTAASYAADDGSLDVDVTSCFTNGTEDEACDEWKEGTINGKIQLLVDPGAIITLKVRFFLNSIMNGGDSSLMPYTDANSVSNTNEVIQSYDTPEIGTWVEHDCSSAFIAQLGDVGGVCYVRWGSNDGAKSKLGEVNADIVLQLHTLAGITRDKAGVALVSSEYRIYKITGHAPETWTLSKSGVSNGSTGVFTEEVGAGNYRIVYIKDKTPQVMDLGPPIMHGNGATDDILTLRVNHNLANDDQVRLYQAGSAALPVGLSEGTTYYVVQLSGDTIKLSLTQGGSAVDITVAGVCWIVGKPETS